MVLPQARMNRTTFLSRMKKFGIYAKQCLISSPPRSFDISTLSTSTSTFRVPAFLS
jgi:hypothetical protein